MTQPLPNLEQTVFDASNPKGAGRYRWRIVALLFFATTVNYIDRQVLSFVIADDVFKRQMLGLQAGSVFTQQNNEDYNIIVSMIDAAFKIAYALGFLLMGWLIDKIGTKKGYSLGIFVWSIAGLVTGLVHTVMGVKIVRFVLGLGESANFPSAIKTIAEWFPKKERSHASGIFNAGTNVGIIITALTVPFIIHHWGWRTAFIITGILGFILLVVWRLTYTRPEENKKLSARELSYINSDNEPAATKKIPWRQLLGYRQTWVFITGKFMADPIWWFYLTWLPKYFVDNTGGDHEFSISTLGIPFLIIYTVSDVGSIFFGWLASRFMHRGWSENRARKTTMLICALCVLPIALAAQTHSMYMVIALIALATAAHQGWSANMYAIAGNLFPKNVVASVTGIGGMAGAIGGVLLAFITGYLINWFGYASMFIIASGAYIVALLIIHLIFPKLKPVNM